MVATIIETGSTRSTSGDDTMRIAALYDVHGNLPALEAVLADVHDAGVDRVLIGGDVLPGPMPDAALARLLALDIPVQFIHGNGDRETLAQLQGTETPWFASAREEWRAPVRWSAQQLDAAHAQTIARWPSTLRMEVPELGEVLFCHATPRNDVDIFTRTTDEAMLRPIFDAARAPVVVCGHTHMPFDRMIGGTRVVNAGSVGMPFGDTVASWILLGPDVEFRKTAYDLTAAAARVRATGYPQADAFADRNVLAAPSEPEMLELFARVPLDRA